MSWSNYYDAADRFCHQMRLSPNDTVKHEDPQTGTIYIARIEAVARQLEETHMQIEALRYAGNLA